MRDHHRKVENCGGKGELYAKIVIGGENMDKFTDMFKYAKLRKSDNKIVNYFGINDVVLGEFSSSGIRKK